MRGRPLFVMQRIATPDRRRSDRRLRACAADRGGAAGPGIGATVGAEPATPTEAGRDRDHRATSILNNAPARERGRTRSARKSGANPLKG